MCSEISRISLSFHKFCGVHQGQVQAGGSSQQAGPVEGAPAHGRGEFLRSPPTQAILGF